MSKIQGWIYKIENKANGKVYIGQTTQVPRVRWQAGHRNNLRKNKHLQASWNKYDIKREAKLLMKKYQIRNLTSEVTCG